MGTTPRLGVLISTICLLAASGIGCPASAEVIDFETPPPPPGPSTFGAAGPAQTVNVSTSIGTVTFTGGVILTNATFLPADETTLYGTASFADASLQSTLTVTFPSNITNFFLDVVNGETFDVTYQVADNLGNSSSFNLVPNKSLGVSTIGFPATGDVVTITPIGSNAEWDFFIDNVNFNAPLPSNLVPEPSTLLLLGTGLTALGGAAWRRRKSRPSAAA